MAQANPKPMETHSRDLRVKGAADRANAAGRSSTAGEIDGRQRIRFRIGESEDLRRGRRRGNSLGGRQIQSSGAPEGAAIVNGGRRAGCQPSIRVSAHFTAAPSAGIWPTSTICSVRRWRPSSPR